MENFEVVRFVAILAWQGGHLNSVILDRNMRGFSMFSNCQSDVDWWICHRYFEVVNKSAPGATGIVQVRSLRNTSRRWVLRDLNVAIAAKLFRFDSRHASLNQRQYGVLINNQKVLSHYGCASFEFSLYLETSKSEVLQLPSALQKKLNLI